MNQNNKPATISRKAARELLWKRGIVSDFLLDENQKSVQSFYKENKSKTLVVVQARQLGKCLKSSTYVATPSGAVQIKDVKVGDIVFGYNKDGTVTPTEVKQVFNQGIKKVVDLTYRGRVIASVTPDHRFWGYNAYTKKLGMVTASELIRTNYWKIKREYFEYVGGDIHEPHAYSLGAMIGDGYCKQQGNCYSISSENKLIPEMVASELGCLVRKCKSNNFSWILNSKNRNDNRSFHKTQFNYYDEWCRGRLAHEKIADYEVIRHWTRESQFRFIAGLLDTDGSVSVAGRTKNELKLEICMQAKKVLECVERMALDLWQVELCWLEDKRPKYKNGSVFRIYSNNNFVVKRILKDLTPYLTLDRKKFKPEYNSFPEHNHVPAYVGVVSGDEYETETYDLGVDNETHLYCLANGLVTHNSYCYVTLAVEECLNNNDFIVCYVGPRLKQTKRIVKDALTDILDSCPPEMRPRFDRDSSSYIFPTTGSRIELYGFNSEEVESARGGKAHLLILDECGFMNDLKYGLRSVLFPKLNTTKGTALLCSTLPKSQGHEFYELIKQAEFRNLLVKRDIYQCPRFTKEDVQRFAEEVGGFDSIDFKREYLNIQITDENYAVIPEANDELFAEIVKEWKRPPYYDCYVSMDIGVKDLTFLIFAYYDFLSGKLIIEDEMMFKGKGFTTNILANGVELKEKQLWNYKKPFMRVADNNNLIMLNDLNIDYGITFRATAKDNKHAWINQLRIMLAEERIIIHPRCKQLQFHLKNATWNKNKTDYERSLDGGHYDAVDALAYMIRNIIFTKNPYPAGYGIPLGDNYISFDGDSDKSEFQKTLISMFTPRKR